MSDESWLSSNLGKVAVIDWSMCYLWSPSLLSLGLFDIHLFYYNWKPFAENTVNKGKS